MLDQVNQVEGEIPWEELGGHPQLASLWVDGASGAEPKPQERVGRDQEAQSLSS